MGLEENRIVDIKRDIDKMYVILPFEKILWR
jgi:lipid A disaccharide synthetase